MSWYYVGPDAQPVGPLSLEELQGRRAHGTIAPETYVIEAPPGSAPKEWRRYRDVFPALTPSGLPPLPGSVQPGPASPTSMGIPHPVFPTPPPVVPSPGGPVFTGTHPSAYHLPPSRNNPYCVWGFALGLASLPLLLFCGLGALVAPVGLGLSIAGLVQLNHHRDQHGRGLAVAGLLLSLIVLLISLVVIFAAARSSWHSTFMTTEQTTNDSDTR